jgi:AcrR family transcriptional regulator
MASTSIDTKGLSLRERTRRAVRVEIATQALALFTEQGFDATTVEQIATAAGISERSFFRYFATKEDVVIGDPAPYALILQAALEECPADAAPWVALRAALGQLIDAVHADPVSSLQASALMLSNPGLRARHLEKQILWEQLLVPNIVERLRGTPAERSLRAHAIVSAALSCLEAALNAWAKTQATESLEHLLDSAISAVQSC